MYFIFVQKSTLFTKGRTSEQMQSRSPVQGGGSCDYRTIMGTWSIYWKRKTKKPNNA